MQRNSKKALISNENQGGVIFRNHNLHKQINGKSELELNKWWGMKGKERENKACTERKRKDSR